MPRAAPGCPGTSSRKPTINGVTNRVRAARPGRFRYLRISLRLIDTATNTSPARAAEAPATPTPKSVQRSAAYAAGKIT